MHLGVWLVQSGKRLNALIAIGEWYNQATQHRFSEELLPIIVRSEQVSVLVAMIGRTPHSRVFEPHTPLVGSIRAVVRIHRTLYSGFECRCRRPSSAALPSGIVHRAADGVQALVAQTARDPTENEKRLLVMLRDRTSSTEALMTCRRLMAELIAQQTQDEFRHPLLLSFPKRHGEKHSAKSVAAAAANPDGLAKQAPHSHLGLLPLRPTPTCPDGLAEQAPVGHIGLPSAAPRSGSGRC
jgi:hypothetical protein